MTTFGAKFLKILPSTKLRERFVELALPLLGQNGKTLLTRLTAVLTQNATGNCRNQFIKFNNKLYTKPAAIAKRFNLHYTNIRKHSSSKESRKINRNLKEEHPLDHSFRPFTLEDTVDAVKSAKNSSALGLMAYLSFTSSISAPSLFDT